MANNKDDVDVQKLYGKECTLSKEEFLKEFGYSENGLSSKKAAEGIEKYGPNEISSSKPKKWYHYLLASLLSPFNCILIGIVFILLYTDVYLASTPSYANIIVILVLVAASTFLEFFQEYRSNKAAEKLKSLVATNAIVLRNGKERRIPIKEIVLGDVVMLSARKYDSGRFKNYRSY